MVEELIVSFILCTDFALFIKPLTQLICYLPGFYALEFNSIHETNWKFKTAEIFLEAANQTI